MITMSQIAGEAGLSRYTVSKILNGDKTVKAASRERVMEICERHGYVPDNNAVNLVRGRSDIIAMIAPYITDGFYSELMELAERRAEALGRRLVYKSSYNDAEKEAGVIKSMLALKVRAMIVAPVVERPDLRIHALAAKNAPIVYFDRPLGEGSRCVLNDNEDSASTMTAHLLGRTDSVAYLDSFYGASNPTALARRVGYAKTMEASGLAPRFIPTDASSERQDNEKFGYENMASALGRGVSFKAVFCITDAVALGAMKAIREAGLKPGEDILVAGHDDLRFSSFVAPSLTTMRQPKERLSEACVDMAERLANGESVASARVVFKSELVVRESA